jgi:hypothetical protein
MYTRHRHAQGSDLRRISEHGGFCGSPKWTPDSKNVVAYCMSAKETRDYRFAAQDGDNKLLSINIATGETTPVSAGPGLKFTPAVLASGTVAYLRRDKTIKRHLLWNGHTWAHRSGRAQSVLVPRRPAGCLQSLRLQAPSLLWKQWSRNKNFDLYGTALIPQTIPPENILP